MQRPCGMNQQHSLGPARRETENRGRGVTEPQDGKEVGVKIKEEEEVRKRRPVSPHAQGPRGRCKRVLVDTIPTGWREASPGPSTLGSCQEAGGSIPATGSRELG